MTTVPDYLKKYYKEPPAHVAERNKSKMHLFQEMFAEMMNPSEEGMQDQLAGLSHHNLASHPKIHRGYYDSKSDGVYYVVDHLGNRVAKHRAYVTITGEFIDRDSGSLLNTPSRLQFSSDVVEDIWRSKSEPTGAKAKKMAKCFYFTQSRGGTQYLVPFNADDFHKVFDESVLTNLCAIIWQNIVGSGSNSVNPSSLTPRTFDEFNSLMARWLNHEAPSRFSSNWGITYTYSPMFGEDVETTNTGLAWYKFPESPWFTSGVMISSRNLSSRSRFISAMENRTYTRIVMNWNYGTITFVEGGNGRAQLNNKTVPVQQLVPDIPDIGFPLYYQMPEAKAIKGGGKTPNNDGVIMQYNDKVDKYKKSFLMTKEEQEYFDTRKKAFEKRQANFLLEKERLHKEHMLATGSIAKKQTAAAFHTHVAKPPVFNPLDEPIFMGFELEVLTRPANQTKQGVGVVIKEIADSKYGDQCIMKFDRSIGDFGFELVSIPATLAHHRKMLEEHFFGLPNAFHNKVMSTNACGLHVHISKKCLTRMDAGKLLAFINSPDNSEFMEDFANRATNTYCAKWNVKGKNRKGVDLSVAAGAKVRFDGQSNSGTINPHHDAVNIQNTHTIEIRIFKSTNNKNNLLRKLEFCEALVKFVRCHSAQQMTVFDFVQFILDKPNKKSYPHLLHWLGAHNFIGHERQQIKGKRKLVHVYGVNKIARPNSLFHKSKQALGDVPKSLVVKGLSQTKLQDKFV